MGTSVLLTSAVEDSEEAIELLTELDRDINLMHFPLERYVPAAEKEAVENVFEEIDAFENIVYGHKRNASFFIDLVKKHNMLKAVRNRLNLALGESTAGFLEQEGIPAVCQPGEAQPINLVEFMLKLRRLGSTLYPCGSHTGEEIPGFLDELDIPVTELQLYDLKGPSEQNLLLYREKLAQASPQVIFFHSRKAVTRTLAAFPDLEYENIKTISADTGITEKLFERGIKADAEGTGTWQSMARYV